MLKPYKSIVSLFPSSLKPPASILLSAHKPAITYIALYLLAGLILGISSGFVVSVNDFWGNWFYAKHMYADMPWSLYNANFPFGYQVVLSAGIRIFHPAVYGYILNLLFAAALLFVVYLFLQRIVPQKWALISVILLSLYPRLFHYIHSAGADAGAVAFFIAGMLILFRQVLDANAGKAATYKWFAAAGLLLGLAALWRYHALVASALLLLSVFACLPRIWKALAACGITVLAVYSPQFVINLLTGHGLLETCHEINVYNLMHDLNWYRVTELELSSSIIDVIAENPLRFAAMYAAGAIKLSVAALPCAAALIITRNANTRLISAVSLVFCLMYSAMFGLGASGRAVLILLPVSFLCTAILLAALEDAHLRIKIVPSRARALFPAVLICLAAIVFLAKDVIRINARIEAIAAYRRVEKTAREHGVKSGSQVFTSDFNIYFPSFISPRPVYNGGWARLATYRYNEIYPELRVDRLEDFFEDCASHDIRMLVLTEESKLLSAVMYSIYAGRLQDARIGSIGEVEKFRLFLIGDLKHDDTFLADHQ